MGPFHPGRPNGPTTKKSDKKADLEAKRTARATERTVLLEGFAKRFNDLAAVTPAPDASFGRAIADEACKHKQQRFGEWYPSDLGCDAALITLGLAASDGGFVRYNFNPKY